MRLFCFPFAGGGASTFRGWPDGLPAGVEVCAVQPPGRENRFRERPFSHLSALVLALSAALDPFLDIPFAFFGHSLGALTSFEMARQLRAQKQPSPLHLFVSGCRAPQVPYSGTPIHALPESEILTELQRLKGTPTEVLRHPELMEILLPLLRADFTLVETYVYTPADPLECAISAFGGLQDDEVSRNQLSAWQDQTLGSFRLQMFAGDHFFLHGPGPRASMLQIIGTTLSRGA